MTISHICDFIEIGFHKIKIVPPPNITNWTPD